MGKPTNFDDLMQLITKVGVDPSDPPWLALQKNILFGISTMMAIAGFFWSMAYAYFGELLAASIPFSYSLVSTISILIFTRTRYWRGFRFSQLFLILMLPFLLMLSLGGFINSSAVIIWSTLCPLGALMFCGNLQAIRWFLLYLGLLIISGISQPYVRLENNLPEPVIVILFVLNIGSVSAIAFVLLNYFVWQKERFLGLLKVEQDKSDNLLLNVLPREIADRLKNDEGVIAEQFSDVSILFADVVGFTPLSTRLAPAEMVRLLNQMFSSFDRLVEPCGMEKIRTIGDNYMVVAGAPTPRTDHAELLATLALDMLDVVHDSSLLRQHNIQIRIGINSGPVIAGVIGTTKFHYDVWGDAVNIASRMESHGQAGKIQLAEASYELLKNKYQCTPRGKISIKGKGEMATWFLGRPILSDHAVPIQESSAPAYPK